MSPKAFYVRYIRCEDGSASLSCTEFIILFVIDWLAFPVKLRLYLKSFFPPLQGPCTQTDG